ncbi:MAG TPA: hypothetical protein VFD77_01815 [Brumimicrobium sp.]|nr:hypothetical protein [Brumimicrobium sp.]
MKKLILGLMILMSFCLLSQTYRPAPSAEEWTVYCYQGLDEEGYSGYYTQNLDVTGNFGANTSLSWLSVNGSETENSSPSRAKYFNNENGEGSNYYNSISNNNSSNISDGSAHSFAHIRSGFPPGIYTFTVQLWDDDSYVYLNDVNISTLVGWGESNTTVEQCVFLGQNSKVKILTNNTGARASGLKFRIELKPSECSQLPVELISFTGKTKLSVNTLSWETATETNNDFFTVAHSSDGFNWSVINKTQGKGNSTSSKSYSIEHRNYPNAINYYRLTQTDYDGKSETFPIVSIDNIVDNRLVKRLNTLGRKVDSNYKGMVIEFYKEGNTVKRIYR